MRKIIAAINTTLDAVCDHTAGIPDTQLNQHYTELLMRSDGILTVVAHFSLSNTGKPCSTPPQQTKQCRTLLLPLITFLKLYFPTLWSVWIGKAPDWRNGT